MNLPDAIEVSAALRQQPSERVSTAGRITPGEPLARHTSWRIGGPARQFYEPADTEDLARFLRALPGGEPLLWLGLGSNMLVRDGGFPGTVIHLGQGLQRVTALKEHMVRAEAGLPCPRLARACAQWGLCGAEFLAGIPGTLGGALAMNAGAFGGETWEHVIAVETLDRQGARRLRAPGDYEIGYRHVAGPGEEWFIAAHLRLSPGDGMQALTRIKSLLAERNRTQPLGLPSAGSVFRNPPGDHAARLIDSCGLKGARIGRAAVSEKHANFIINQGGATAHEVESLMAHIADTVESRYGVRLRPEVCVVGAPRVPRRET